MSTQHNSDVNNNLLEPLTQKMLAHGRHAKGSSEDAGVKLALTLAFATVLLMAAVFALSCWNPPLQRTLVRNVDAPAAISSPASQKARHAAYQQHKPIDSVFAETMDPL